MIPPAATRFQNYFDWLIPWEGETYENDPDDPGGETKFGLDKRSHPELDIRAITRAQARDIYLREYWDRVRADDLPAGIGEIVCDIAVNNGPVRAAKWLQEAIGAAPDGVVGPRTLLAATRQHPRTLGLVLLHRRANFYRSIARGAMSKYLNGWLKRNASLEHLTEPLLQHPHSQAPIA